MRVAISFTDRMFNLLLDGHAHSQGETAVHCPRCLHTGCLDNARLSPPASRRRRLLRTKSLARYSGRVNRQTFTVIVRRTAVISSPL